MQLFNLEMKCFQFLSFLLIHIQCRRCVFQQGSVETGSATTCWWSVTGSEEEEGGGGRRRRKEEGRGYLSNDIIATEPVLVHDGDNYGGLPQHVGRHVEGEGLVENRVEAALHHHRLLLLHTLVLVHQPHFYIGVCGEGKCGSLRAVCNILFLFPMHACYCWFHVIL